MMDQSNLRTSQTIDFTKRTGWAQPVNFTKIPDFLQNMPCGVWTAEIRENGKVNKIPRHPRGGWKLSVAKPEQWASYSEVKKAYEAGLYDGIGVLMKAGSGIVGLDIDGWESLVETHADVFLHLEDFMRRDGYVERSPSGKGLRAFMTGYLPSRGRKQAGLEIYDQSRFLTVTGHQIEVLHDNAC